MKTTKKILAGVLAVAMMLALCVSALAAPQEKIKYRYAAIGASNTNGYGLHGFWPEAMYDSPHDVFKDPEPGQDGLMLARDGYYTSGYYFYSDDAYPVLVKNALQQRLGDTYEVELDQLGINSLRAYDMRYFLDDNWASDGYYEWRMGNGGDTHWQEDIERERHETIEIPGWDTLQIDKERTNLREEMKEAVYNADFITYDLGINDFGSYISGFLFGNSLMDANPENLTRTGELAGKYYALFLKAKDAIMAVLDPIIDWDAINEKMGSDVMGLVDHLVYAYVGFVESFDGTMKLIYENNPDVEVVVCSIGNVFEGATIEIDGIQLPFGQMMGTSIDLANAYTSLISPYHTKYLYADCSDNGHVEYFRNKMLEWDGVSPDTLDPCIIDAFSGYDFNYITPWITDVTIADYGGSVFTNYEGFFNYEGNYIDYGPDYGAYKYSVYAADKYSEDATVKADYAMVEKRSNDAQYYLLAYFCKKALEKQDMKLNKFVDLGYDFVTPLAAMLFYGYNGQYGADGLALWTPMTMEEIYGLERSWVDALLSDPAVAGAAYYYAYTQFAACFFSHPSQQGHFETYEAVMKAYDKGIKGPQVALGEIIERTMGVIQSALQGIRTLSKNIIERVIANIPDCPIISKIENRIG